MKSFSSESLLKAVLVMVPTIFFSVVGCGGSGQKPNELIQVDKNAEQAKEQMIKDAYKNQKPARTEAQSKADMIRANQKSSN
ncbi:MAG: hypothetical protein WCJ40_10145 [Planctomycetota bacterium]